FDKEQRPKFQNTAINALKKAVALHPANWEAAYALAVQHASVGNVDQAISVAEKALSLNSRYTNTYHLLVILLTAKRRLDGALLVCDAGLLDSDGPEALSAFSLSSLGRALSATSATAAHAVADGPGSGSASRSPTENRAAHTITGAGPHGRSRPLKTETAFAEEAEAYFALQMTRMAIIQAQNGHLSDVTLKTQERLHALHGKVYGSLSTLWEAPGRPVAQALQARLWITSSGHCKGLHAERSGSVSSANSGGRPLGATNSAPAKLHLQDGGNGNRVSNVAPVGTAAGGGAGAAAKGDGGGVIQSSASGTLRQKPYAASVASVSAFSVRSQLPAAGGDLVRKSPSLSQLAKAAANPPSANSTGGILSSLVPDRRGRLPETRSSKRNMRGFKALTELWLFSARGLRESALYDKAAEMLDIAEAVGVNEADVYCEVGARDRALLLIDQSLHEEALACLLRALSNDAHHVRSEVALGKLHLAMGRLDLAEGVLTAATEGLGWASPEAWLLLGKVYSAMGRYRRARECLLFAASWDSVTGLKDVGLLPQCP
ncbi:MAG: hypothetical protein BJ554DRAFT_2281, partial [Olpidium bornovanus]